MRRSLRKTRVYASRNFPGAATVGTYAKKTCITVIHLLMAVSILSYYLYAFKMPTIWERPILGSLQGTNMDLQLDPQLLTSEFGGGRGQRT